jgi:uncharacterized protein (TIGR02118 family)
MSEKTAQGEGSPVTISQLRVSAFLQDNEGEHMIKVSIFYPDTEGARFDMDYYLRRHMPMSIELLSAARGFRGVSVERGVGGAGPGLPPTYVAMCHYLFDSVEEFVAAFQQHAALLQGDIANYTDIPAVIQFSAVELTR